MQKNRLCAALGLALLMCAALPPAAASGTEPPRASSDWEDKAKAALEELRQAYVREDRNGFFNDVSDRSSFNYLDFKNRTGDHWSHSSQTDLVITVDHALKSGDKAVLKTHWQKRSVTDATGQSENSEGQADFVFELAPSSKLIDVQGDNPF